jgi:hypothetical protein
MIKTCDFCMLLFSSVSSLPVSGKVGKNKSMYYIHCGMLTITVN